MKAREDESWYIDYDKDDDHDYEYPPWHFDENEYYEEDELERLIREEEEIETRVNQRREADAKKLAEIKESGIADIDRILAKLKDAHPAFGR